MSLSNLVLDMMFSSNPFAQFASSIHVFPPPNSFLDTEKNDLFINHFNNPFVSGDRCLHPYSPSFTTSKQDSGGFERLGLEQCDDEHNHELGSEVSLMKKKKTSKKDHHSKIHTAQGPRDRRVRLSIDVARKFFYLQDLLGFDKASKTLDWLFTKSKIPIDELVQGQKHSSPSTVTDESQVFFREKAESDEQDKEQKKKSKSRCAEGKRKKTTRICKSEIPLNQSRADARARARERTKEKLHIKKLDDEYKKFNGDSCCCCCPGSPSYLKLQSSYWSAIESRNNHNDRFGETVMEGNISMLHSYQHNLDVSNDSTSKFMSSRAPLENFESERMEKMIG